MLVPRRVALSLFLFRCRDGITLNQLQGPADKIEEAKPGLRAIVEEPANGILHSSCVF